MTPSPSTASQGSSQPGQENRYRAVTGIDSQAMGLPPAPSCSAILAEQRRAVADIRQDIRTCPRITHLHICRVVDTQNILYIYPALFCPPSRYRLTEQDSGQDSRTGGRIFHPPPPPSLFWQPAGCCSCLGCRWTYCAFTSYKIDDVLLLFIHLFIMHVELRTYCPCIA